MSAATGGADQKGLMDATYALHRHFYDFTRKFYLLGRDALIRGLNPPEGGTVLEVGCGTARNLIVAAKRFPRARFFGFDISEAMLETARASVEKNGLGSRITLAQGDAGAFDVTSLFGLEKLDRVFMSYTLSMIPPWVEAIELGARALAPGGSLHIVDFGQYERLPGFAKRLHFKSLNDFHVFPRAELPAVLKRVAEEQGLRLDFRSSLRGYVWSATLTRD
ncbi:MULTISPECIES: class I SAM-dependent methyltransferase [Sphingomonas]|uniref:S-adenosylmethionine-diacylgycerolhomoserine-N-methyltransferase n=1 Tax=Sphingomonas leidyi TaxID=68569 RepID=A0A7X5V3V0_9SPHN|nr:MULTISPECIES: class I SAM-dependent methyltransferase [Sphingomonas]MBN8812277.1 class I SAM-dependent methyltransferase [Sphingomonas sp.]NIJ67000.1 S-adenosylmethionine-diacylgycerolhomoserine-N-methyltransferase [Sphingomonas leidyi]OJY47977.1 MAG: methyltransferase [Sphingomonas sp. 67-41]